MVLSGGDARASSELAVAKGSEGGLGFDLPLETRLNIRGRKSIGFRISGQVVTPKPGAPPPPGVTFGLDQELQVRLQGTIQKRVTVNVDYDDTKAIEDQQRDISVFYKGPAEEFVQEAAFGDVVLTIPNT